MRALAFAISFTLAFLLFAVQPMATRMVLPTLGGTPAVWNTVMFTFQLLLLAGYGYAHLLTHLFRTRWQWWIHTAMIASSFWFLPLLVTLGHSDTVVNSPIASLLMAFLTQIGLPFFCLAATAPLLQSWVSRSTHPLSNTPYVLYSASNLGSFAGLLGYVAVVEPLLDLHQQSQGWSVLYILGMLVLLLVGRRLSPRKSVATAPELTANVTWCERWVWIGLAFLPSTLSLGVTTYIATDIASIPLLWVIPLALYLLSFVDAFRTRPVIVSICQRIAPIIGLTALILYGVGGNGSAATYIFQLAAFAVLAFAIHGWLAARQPDTQHLTQFYFCLSIGGALGGLLNGLVAPQIFRQALEYPVMLLVASLVAFVLLQRRDDPAITVRQHVKLMTQAFLRVAILSIGIYVAVVLVSGKNFIAVNGILLLNAAGISGLVSLLIVRRYIAAVYSCAAFTVIMLCAMGSSVGGSEILFKDRNFFGVSRVYENTEHTVRYFAHDTTVHGLQSLNPREALHPMSYYYPLKEVLSHISTGNSKPMAVVGQGVGTLKCFAAPKQKVDFYEINPMVKMLAENENYFTYMRDCPGESRVLLGDGRIRIAEQENARYGVIVLDAFSSDAIPSHLLTREALAMYLDKLTPDGVLLINTTNRHIDLWPLLAAQAHVLDVSAYGKFYQAPKNQTRLMSCMWVVIAKSPKSLSPLLTQTEGWKKLADEGNRPWTDQYVNLLPYFKALR
jgi:spermidine synthase